MGKRIENWAIVLGNELQKPRKFIWGIEDCCLFSANIVNTITNIDVAQSYRGKYNSKISNLVQIGVTKIQVVGSDYKKILKYVPSHNINISNKITID